MFGIGLPELGHHFLVIRPYRFGPGSFRTWPSPLGKGWPNQESQRELKSSHRNRLEGDLNEKKSINQRFPRRPAPPVPRRGSRGFPRKKAASRAGGILDNVKGESGGRSNSGDNPSRKKPLAQIDSPAEGRRPTCPAKESTQISDKKLPLSAHLEEFTEEA